jgi:hypothetical protein
MKNRLDEKARFILLVATGIFLCGCGLGVLVLFDRVSSLW